MMPTPEISVVVAMLDETSFEPLLHGLQRQQGLETDGWEIIVVDSTPYGIGDFNSGDLPIRLIPGRGFCRAKAMNAGIALTTAPILYFLADDFVPVPGAVVAHRDYHRRCLDSELSALGPGFFNAKIRTHFMHWLEESGSLFGVPFGQITGSLPHGFWYGANASLKREMFQRVGAFDEDFPHDAWDDYEYSQRLFRAGMRVDYLPEAGCLHEHVVSMAERRLSVRRAGEAAVIFESKYPGQYPWQKTVMEGSAIKPRHREWSDPLRAKWFSDDRVKCRLYPRILNREFAASYWSASALRPILSDCPGRRIGIFGNGKTGTTALFYAIRESLDAAASEGGFELPSEEAIDAFLDVGGDRLCKVMPFSWKQPPSHRVLNRFTHRIVIYRDPRDTFISWMLYSILRVEWVSDRSRVEAWITALEAKERDPTGIPLLQLLDLLNGNCPGSGLEEIDSFVGRVWLAIQFQNRCPSPFLLRYEDMVAGNLSPLEEHLGIPVRRDEDVEEGVHRVVRAKSRGSWSHWFTASDIEVLESRFTPLLRAYGYPENWILNADPQIAPEHGSEYVRRILSDVA